MNIVNCKVFVGVSVFHEYPSCYLNSLCLGFKPCVVGFEVYSKVVLVHIDILVDEFMRFP